MNREFQANGTAGGRVIANAAVDGFTAARNFVTGNGNNASAASTTAAPAAPASTAATSTENENEAEGQENGTGSTRWSVSKILGGLLGVGGAWIITRFFGGGMLGTIAFALLAIPAAMMGSSSIGGFLNNMFGGRRREETSNEQQQERAAQPAQERAQGATVDAPAQAIPQAPATTPMRLNPQSINAIAQHPQLHAEISEFGGKAHLAQQAIASLTRSGQLSPQETQRLQRFALRIGTETTGVERSILNVAQNPEMAPNATARIRRLNNDFDAAINTTYPTVLQEMQRLQLVQQHGSVAFANPQTSIGAHLAPDVRQQVTQAAGPAAYPVYAAQTAELANLQAQQFSGIPAESLPEAFRPRTN